MRKLFKKIATVVAAVAMVASMAVTSFAAEDPGKVYVVGAMSDWSFVEMESVGNGVYTKTFEGKTPGECEFKFTLQDAWTHEVSPVGGGNFKTTIGDDGKVTFTLDFNKLADPVDNNGNNRYEVEEGSAAITFAAPAPAETEAPTQAPTQAPTEGATQAPTEGATQASTEGATQAPTPAPTPDTGDSTAVVAMAAVAAVAGALVLATRKQTANN